MSEARDTRAVHAHSLVPCLSQQPALSRAPPPLALVHRSAKNGVNGMPQAVTCTVTVALTDLPVSFTATAYQGNPSSPKAVDLRSAESNPYMCGRLPCWGMHGWLPTSGR